MNLKIFGLAASISFCGAALAQGEVKVAAPPPTPAAQSGAPAFSPCRAPQYPAEARRYELEGKAIVKFVVDLDGRVSRAEIAQSSGWKILDQATLDVITGCRFKPTSDGAAHRVNVAYDWKLAPSGEPPATRPALLAGSCAASDRLVVADPGQIADTIYMRFLLTVEGTVYGVVMERGSGDGALDAAAMTLARTCRYTPSMRAGQPVSGISTIRFKALKSAS